MRSKPDPNRGPRVASALSGTTLLVAAAFAGWRAYAHMQALGEVCGGSPLVGHCVWCAAVVALAAAGVAALVAPSPRLAKAR